MGEQLDSYLFQGYKHYVKCKQSLPGFELGSWFPFPMTVTIAPQEPAYVCMYVLSHKLWFFAISN